MPNPEWNKQHLKEMREARQRYRSKPENKEKERLYKIKWQAKNRNKVNQQKRESYQRNKEKISTSQKRYRQTERGRRICALGTRNHNILKRANGTGITTQQWEDIIRKYNYRCAYCGKRCYLTQDHIIPLSRGGEHSPDNIVPACSECNGKKGVRLDWEPKIFRKVI